MYGTTLISSMGVDFYEFTMANCLFLNGFKDTTLVFDMFFRKKPDNMGYSISAGQRKLTRFLLNYHFNEQDIQWLSLIHSLDIACDAIPLEVWRTRELKFFSIKYHREVPMGEKMAVFYAPVEQGWYCLLYTSRCV